MCGRASARRESIDGAQKASLGFPEEAHAPIRHSIMTGWASGAGLLRASVAIALRCALPTQLELPVKQFKRARRFSLLAYLPLK